VLATAADHVSTDTLTETSPEVSCWKSEEQMDLCLVQCAPCLVACVINAPSLGDSGTEYAFDFAAATCRETEDTSGAGCAESQCSQCIEKMPCILQDDDETFGGAVERHARSHKGKKSAAQFGSGDSSGSGDSGSALGRQNKFTSSTKKGKKSKKSKKSKQS